MTYGKLKERVMQLIFSYSVAGSEIPDTYNNQADYLAMIPSLVNDAQMDVATTVRRLPAIAELSSLEHHSIGGKERFASPEYRAASSKRARDYIARTGDNIFRSPIPVICIETGTEYPSMNAAEKELGISHRSISKVCNGFKCSAGGLHWRFA